MSLLTLDIETLPSDKPPPLDEVERAAWLQESLDGTLGRVFALSFIDELIPGTVAEGVMGWDGERFEMDETKILQDFWYRMRRFNRDRDRLLGWNTLGFDLPFILKRSRILGVRPTCHLSLARYRSSPIYDAMQEWGGWQWNGKDSLQKVATAMGLAGKFEGLDGSKVYEYWRDGRHSELYQYALQDARLVRQVYSRMTFETIK